MSDSIIMNTYAKTSHKQFAFSLKDRAGFYVQYLYRKLLAVWVEVERPKLTMAYYEYLYTASKLIKPLEKQTVKSSCTRVDTLFGKFYVRPGTLDAIMVLPSYERPDISRMLKILNSDELRSKRVAFLDIGADIGTYSICAGNFTPKSNIEIFSFEPTKDSFNILKKNIRLNKLSSKITPLNIGLSDSTRQATFWTTRERPGGNKLNSVKGRTREEVKLTTLDSAMKDKVGKYDIAVIKLDVEGHEEEVLKGGKTFLGSMGCVLLVEDFGDTNIVRILDKTGWRFNKKVTTYNSWWVRKARS